MINVNSEIMPLRKVLVHRPGNEILNIVPSCLDRFLYDSIPYLKVMRDEYEQFIKVFKDNKIDLVYVEEIMAYVLDINPSIKEKFIKQYIYEAGVRTPKYKEAIYKYLMEFNNRDLVFKTIEGITYNELSKLEFDYEHSLEDLVKKEDLFLIEPMCNLIYTRDLVSVIGNGISLNKMNTDIRYRESIYMEYIFEYHPEYKNISKYYDKYNTYSIEGGDILVLNENTLAIGVSERTNALAIEELANNIFNDKNSLIDTILVIDIPDMRDYMHLDTVFTQVDYDKYLYYPGIMNKLRLFVIKEDVMDGIKVVEVNDTFEEYLEKYLKRDILLIPCGGGDRIISRREQANCGVGVLCISPGVVISYDRNNITNAVLRRYGIKVIEIPSSELICGKGGPRCMSMPLIRDNN